MLGHEWEACSTARPRLSLVAHARACQPDARTAMANCARTALTMINSFSCVLKLEVLSPQSGKTSDCTANPYPTPWPLVLFNLKFLVLGRPATTTRRTCTSIGTLAKDTLEPEPLHEPIWHMCLWGTEWTYWIELGNQQEQRNKQQPLQSTPKLK